MRLLQFPVILLVAVVGVIVLVQSVRGQGGGQEVAVPTPTLTAREVSDLSTQRYAEAQRTIAKLVDEMEQSSASARGLARVETNSLVTAPATRAEALRSSETLSVGIVTDQTLRRVPAKNDRVYLVSTLRGESGATETIAQEVRLSLSDSGDLFLTYPPTVALLEPDATYALLATSDTAIPDALLPIRGHVYFAKPDGALTVEGISLSDAPPTLDELRRDFEVTHAR